MKATLTIKNNLLIKVREAFDEHGKVKAIKVLKREIRYDNISLSLRGAHIITNIVSEMKLPIRKDGTTDIPFEKAWNETVFYWKLSRTDKLDKLIFILEWKEGVGMAEKIRLVREGVTDLRKPSFYDWYTSLDIKGIFLEALTIQMRLDHGHDVDFDFLHTSDYKTCWNKVLDGRGEK